MTINRPLANQLAQPITEYLKHYRPDLKLTNQIVASQIASPEHVGSTPAQIMQAAWKLADHLANRGTKWKTFGMLPSVIESLAPWGLEWENDWAEPSGVVTSWAGDRRPEPHGGNGNHSQKVEECPAHTGKPKNNCPGCLADVKAGDREPSQMNVVL